MLRRTAAFILLAGVGIAPALTAQDVMTVAPNHYRVLVENPWVRVVENTLEPGASDPLHTHPAGWYIVTQPGKMKVVFAGGKTELWEPKLGESAWMNAEAPHTSQNVGDTPIRYVLVEVKRVGSETSLAEPRRRVAQPLLSHGSH